MKIIKKCLKIKKNVTEKNKNKPSLSAPTPAGWQREGEKH